MVQFTCAVQGRRRLSPPRPDDFLGNCVTWCAAKLDFESLTSASSSLYNVACTLHSAITRIDSDHLRGVIGMAESVPDFTHLEITSYDDPERSFGVSSLADLGLYQLDRGARIAVWNRCASRHSIPPAEWPRVRYSPGSRMEAWR